MAQSVSDDRGRRLRELVEEVKLYSNPEELEAIKKDIRKNVPLSMRGYLAAYLFVTSGKNKTAAPVRKAESRNSENSTALYVNVGKASRSSAHELGEFITEKAKIDSSVITGIAFKQNYSFIYVSKDKAQGIIDSVNGQEFKGRKVKVDFSKEKDEN